MSPLPKKIRKYCIKYLKKLGYRNKDVGAVVIRLLSTVEGSKEEVCEGTYPKPGRGSAVEPDLLPPA